MPRFSVQFWHDGFLNTLVASLCQFVQILLLRLLPLSFSPGGGTTNMPATPPQHSAQRRYCSSANHPPVPYNFARDCAGDSARMPSNQAGASRIPKADSNPCGSHFSSGDQTFTTVIVDWAIAFPYLGTRAWPQEDWGSINLNFQVSIFTPPFSPPSVICPLPRSASTVLFAYPQQSTPCAD